MYLSHWEAPSNIAFIKYWGKKGVQIPISPSLSMSLRNAMTRTKVVLTERHDQERVLISSFLFHGAEKESFKQRIQKYLESLVDKFSWLREWEMKIESENSFPHSAGIASSASAFSSLALCLVSLDELIMGKARENFWQVASSISRLGSGSACRSIYGGFSLWGNYPEIKDSCDDFAIPFVNAHPKMKQLNDAIIILDDGVKEVSSSRGHALMDGHLFKEGRLKQVQQHLHQMIQAFSLGDFELFGEILEREALSLHALMMSSSHSFILFNEKTIQLIQRLRKMRSSNNISLYFTLDAGANLHLIYPQVEEKKVKDFIQKQLLSDFASVKVLWDSLGSGPKRIA